MDTVIRTDARCKTFLLNHFGNSLLTSQQRLMTSHCRTSRMNWSLHQDTHKDEENMKRRYQKDIGLDLDRFTRKSRIMRIRDALRPITVIVVQLSVLPSIPSTSTIQIPSNLYYQLSLIRATLVLASAGSKLARSLNGIQATVAIRRHSS